MTEPVAPPPDVAPADPGGAARPAPDPLALLMGMGALALLVAVAVIYLG